MAQIGNPIRKIIVEPEKQPVPPKKIPKTTPKKEPVPV